MRGLVEALNAIPGVATVESCEGHVRGAPAWVAFVAQDPETPQRLAEALARLLGPPPADPSDPCASGPVHLHPYLAYGVGLEWRLLVTSTDPRVKARLVREVALLIRARLAPVAVATPRPPRGAPA